MAERIVEYEADTLEEAQRQVWARVGIPEGYYYASHDVVSDGKPRAARASADSPEAAWSQAAAGLPANAQVVSRKQLSDPQRITVVVTSFDEAAAQASARSMAARELGEWGEVGSVRLVAKGSQGMLGIGRKPNRYEAVLYRPAVVEVTYQTRPKIAARVVDAASRVSLLIEELGRRSGSDEGPREALRFLAPLHDKDARVVPAIAGALDAAHPGVRVRAAEILGEIGDPAAVEPLIRTLRRGSGTPAPFLIRAAAAQSLGRLGDARAIGALEAAAHDGDWHVEEAARKALSRLKPEKEWADMLGLLRALAPSTPDAIRKLQEWATVSAELRGAPEALRWIQDQYEAYTRVARLTSSPTSVTVVLDDFLARGANVAPATRELTLTVVSDGGRLLGLGSGTFL